MFLTVTILVIVMNINKLIGRHNSIFSEDLEKLNKEIRELVEKSKFLIIGAAGSIGSAVTKEIFKRDPKLLHIIDINENNLVELVRDLRSSIGYTSGEFKTFAVDCGSREFEVLLSQATKYDYVMNLSALNHVRSESDPFTLMRMLQVNVINPVQILKNMKNHNLSSYFSVSTDKAANPVNLMGGSKNIMEKFLFRESVKRTLRWLDLQMLLFQMGHFCMVLINVF